MNQTLTFTPPEILEKPHGYTCKQMLSCFTFKFKVSNVQNRGKHLKNAPAVLFIKHQYLMKKKFN